MRVNTLISREQRFLAPFFSLLVQLYLRSDPVLDIFKLSIKCLHALFLDSDFVVVESLKRHLLSVPVLSGFYHLLLQCAVDALK